MKSYLLILFLALLTLAPLAHAQQPAPAWPRNPTTGKVEFRGTLPWPAGVKTEAQRKALVRRWYLAKLTDESAQAVDESARTAVSPTLLTYASLPVGAVMSNSKQPVTNMLAYTVLLKAASAGLLYTLEEFHFTHAADTDLGPELEQVLATDAPADRPALAALRQRLAAALANW